MRFWISGKSVRKYTPASSEIPTRTASIGVTRSRSGSLATHRTTRRPPVAVRTSGLPAPNRRWSVGTVRPSRRERKPCPVDSGKRRKVSTSAKTT